MDFFLETLSSDKENIEEESSPRKVPKKSGKSKRPE